MKDLGSTFTLILVLSFAIEAVVSRFRSESASSRSHELIRWAVSVVVTYGLCNLGEVSIFKPLVDNPKFLPMQLQYFLTALVVAAGVDHIAAFRKKLVADTEVAKKEVAKKEVAENEPGSEKITIDGTLVLDEDTRKLLIRAVTRE
jgi:hypothetical protein